MIRSVENRAGRLVEHADDVLSAVGTPAIVFFEADLRESYGRLRRALDEHYPYSTVHVAVKANFTPAILSAFADEGAHAEAYAGCEIEAAARAGFEPDEILVTGMNRDDQRVRDALRSGTRRFLVDNHSELRALASIAEEVGTQAEVMLRVNPELEIPTHPDIATGTRDSKFGMSVSTGAAMDAVRRTVESDAVVFHGLQCHLGSQIESVAPYREATRGLLAFAGDLKRETGATVDALDLGGGFPVEYDDPVPPIEEYVSVVADTIAETCAELGIDEPALYLEPGRYLLAPSGTLLGEVGVLKETPERTFAVLDAGTNTVLTRQSIPIYAPYNGGPTEEYDVVGPLCHSGDVFAESVELSRLAEGDVVALDRVGAYTIGRETNMNGVPMPPIVLVESDGDHRVVRERQTCADVIPGAGD